MTQILFRTRKSIHLIRIRNDIIRVLVKLVGLRTRFKKKPSINILSVAVELACTLYWPTPVALDM